MSSLKLAHISDLHFAKLTWDPCQFFSKRWLGNLNVALCRKHAFDPNALSTLIPLFQQKQVKSVLITGDLSSTSQASEFEMAQGFVRSLEQEGLSVFAIPGNHDHYTKSAYKKQLFYDFFPSPSLRENKVSSTYLGHNFWLISLDTACATSLISSNGLFSEKIEQALSLALQEIPEGHSVILMNHFALFSHTGARKSLWRRQALLALLKKHPCIKLYLHGHTHHHSVADLRADDLPIILDSGSTSLEQGGSWNLIEISEKGCKIESFRRAAYALDVIWEPFATHQFSWKSYASLV